MLQFAVPVIQFGMNIEDFVDADSGSGNYSISFLAYDAGGNLIGNTDALGVFTPPAIYSSTGCSNNSCLSFEGITVSGDAISSIIFNDSGVGGGSNDLMFGNIAYAPRGTALQAPPPAVTPEPSSFLLLGSGLLGLTAVGRRAGGFLRASSARRTPKGEHHDLPGETHVVRLPHPAGGPCEDRRPHSLRADPHAWLQQRPFEHGGAVPFARPERRRQGQCFNTGPGEDMPARTFPTATAPSTMSPM